MYMHDNYDESLAIKYLKQGLPGLITKHFYILRLWEKMQREAGQKECTATVSLSILCMHLFC